jgi:hypothetical protein
MATTARKTDAITTAPPTYAHTTTPPAAPAPHTHTGGAQSAFITILHLISTCAQVALVIVLAMLLAQFKKIMINENGSLRIDSDNDFFNRFPGRSSSGPLFMRTVNPPA